MANGFREILQLCRAPVWSGGFEVDEPDLRRMKLGGNLIGDILYHLLMPTYDTVLERQFQGRCWLRLGPLVMAIRLHERQHGRRPASLAELVPAILPELPRDPFTGEPFRYSSSEGTVYSVGRNQRDEGGLQEHGGDADDCGLHLDTGREIVDSRR